MSFIKQIGLPGSTGPEIVLDETRREVFDPLLTRHRLEDQYASVVTSRVRQICDALGLDGMSVRAERPYAVTFSGDSADHPAALRVIEEAEASVVVDRDDCGRWQVRDDDSLTLVPVPDADAERAQSEIVAAGRGRQGPWKSVYPGGGQGRVDQSREASRWSVDPQLHDRQATRDEPGLER